jgi:hypothetical protein
MTTTEQSAGPPPQGLTSGVPFVSGHGRAQVLIALFMAYIAVKLFAIVSNVMQIGLLRDALSGGSVTREQAEWNDQRQLLAAVISLLILAALLVALLLWLYRVASNLTALGNPKSRIEYTPGWAVGSFFIPFANLFMPYRAFRECWVKSAPLVRTEEEATFPPRTPTPLLAAWWVSWILMGVVGRVAGRFRTRAGDADALVTASWVSIAAELIGIVSAVLAVFFVRALDRRQEERGRDVTYVPHTPPPPPLNPLPPQRQP